MTPPSEVGRAIAHLSDLHFGAHDPCIANALRSELVERRPSLVVVSGDLTQRARSAQFHAAKSFFDEVALPWLAVPGNHDIPLFDVVRRALRPFARYRRIVCDELEPMYADDAIAVVGINTTRPTLWKNGRVSSEQMARATEQFARMPATHTKILVAHHPFLPPHDDPQSAFVHGAANAMRSLEAVGCWLILGGHMHRASWADARGCHVALTHSILAIQAGTAISHRRRGEANAYNWLALHGDRMTLSVRRWNGERFVGQMAGEYIKDRTGWIVHPPLSAG